MTHLSKRIDGIKIEKPEFVSENEKLAKLLKVDSFMGLVKIEKINEVLVDLINKNEPKLLKRKVLAPLNDMSDIFLTGK